MEKESLKTEDARPHFFKIIYGEDVKQHLGIPPAFMKHLPQEIPNRAILTGPSGSHWHATVSTDENGTYLQEGWKEFMKENNLGDNEFLIFRYDGNMQFYVKIFDKSGVIRPAAPVSDINNGKRGQGRPKERPVGIFDKSRVIRPAVPVSDINNGKRGRGRPRKCPVRIFDKSRVIRPVAPVSDINNGKGGLGRPMKRPVGSLDLHEQKLHGSEEGPGQSCRIGKMAKTFTSQSPHFMASMIKSNVEKSFLMRIPKSFSAAAQFPPSRRKVVLRDSAGKAWDVICLPDRGGHCFSGGWISFARHNNLKTGDVCIFELISKDEMQVHVL